MSSSRVVTLIDDIDKPEVYENEHVHEIYDNIASHFSSTRYKPWPIVVEFLRALPTGWIGLDSGTGNGKYLSLPDDVAGSRWLIGMDRSRNLLKHAMHAGDSKSFREVVLGDVITCPWRAGVFDYAISIATIHHLASYNRRKQAVQSLLRSISPTHGRALIYVWAIQQDSLSKRIVPSTNPLEASKKGQDVIVPWVSPRKQETVSADEPGMVTYDRYYHMFDEGELQDLVSHAAKDLGITVCTTYEPGITTPVKGVQYLNIVRNDWERSNWFVEFRLSKI